MEENEGLEVENESGATDEGASPEPSTTEGQAEAPGKEASNNKPETTDFNEHPRFKELIEQKNYERTQREYFQKRLEQLETKMSQPAQTQKQQEAKDELIEDLEKIDPRLAARLKQFTESHSTVQDLVKKLEGFEKQNTEREQMQTVNTAVSKINSWHDSNKVSPEVKQIINDKLDLLYGQGKLNLQNLEKTYNDTFAGLKKFEDAIKRSERESYVKGKKEDAAVPTSQPKGMPAKAAPKKPTWSKDPELARAQVVSRFLKQQSANKQADSV